MNPGNTEPSNKGATSKREVQLLKLLADGIEDRLPADLSEDEQILRGQELVRADPELIAIVTELEELAEKHDGPALWQR